MTITSFSKKHLEAMIKMTNQTYGKIDIANRQYLLWQYQKNPAGEALIKLALDRDHNRLAGQYVVLPKRFVVGGKEVLGSLSVNTLIKKEYQGKGVFTLLAKKIFEELKEKKLAFTYGFPNQNSYPGFVKKLTFADLGTIDLLFFPLGLSWLLSLETGQNKSLKILELNEKNIKMVDSFWLRVKNKYKIMQIRDSGYMAWRYLTIPRRQYKIFALLVDDEMVGYIVGRVTPLFNVKVGLVVDFLLAPGTDQKRANFLITALLKYFKTRGVFLSGSLMLRQTQEYHCLRNRGFLKCPKIFEPQPFPVIFKLHTPIRSAKVLTRLDNWFLTMGDYDVI